MKKVIKEMKTVVFYLCGLCIPLCFVACSNSEYDGKNAEQLAEQFYTYYIDNYMDVGEKCEEIANKYLTEEFGKSYIHEMKRTYPVDLLSSGLMYNKGDAFYGSFNKAEYVGENKVNVSFDKPDGGQYHWLLTISKVGTEYRIANVEVNN